ncbi:non-reducing end alpha-L-arabinofuranosidase family hydrolase [Streptomyces sp. CA-251387]|uniref:non-reducing end alpha-L-arabinofuranosidase family hydrolase n=1 Tax=Streptomyces sp. CA-251387 TaxID=3240064 RepID=UPI003D90C9F5
MMGVSMSRCFSGRHPARGRAHADSTYAYVDQRAGAHAAGLRRHGRSPGPRDRRQLSGGSCRAVARLLHLVVQWTADRAEVGRRASTIVLSEPNRFDLFEGSNVYRLGSSGKYLLLVEALATGSDWRRYFRAWTADSLGGAWTPLARDGVDQTLTINPCGLQFLYQGMAPASSGDYSQLPWRLALVTQTNSSC